MEALLVEALKGVEIIASRASAAGADYLLAGPLNLWFHGITENVDSLLYMLVTSSKSGEVLDKAVSVNAERVEWPESWGNVGGKRGLYLLYGRYKIGVLVDPSLYDGEDIKFYPTSMLARLSSVVLVSGLLVRLAPLSFEAELSSHASYEDMIKAGTTLV